MPCLLLFQHNLFIKQTDLVKIHETETVLFA